MKKRSKMDTLVRRSRIEVILEKILNFDFGKKKYEKYSNAMESLCRAEYCMDHIGVKFPDTSCLDLPLLKNEWTSLPSQFATKVQQMGIHLGNDYWSVLTYIKKGGEIKPHKHSGEYEVIKIVEGKVIDRVTDKIYERGEVIFLNKNQIHHLVAEDEECYMYMLFTKKKEYIKIPHQETELVEYKIKSENGKVI